MKGVKKAYFQEEILGSSFYLYKEIKEKKYGAS